jgi:hypothetical protein
MRFFHNFHIFRNSSIVAPVTFFLLLSSCMKKEVFPIIPEIAYQTFTTEFDTGMYATRGFLTISFKDGDGDIGLLPAQNKPPYDYNYIIDYYEKQNGKFVKVELDPPYNARIPYLTPDDPNKAIKGIIVDTLALNPHPVYDTVKFKFFILDRALHESNVDSTPPIILRRR